MTEKQMIDLKILSNSYTEKRITSVIDELEKALLGTNNNVVYTRKLAERVIGKFIALAYAQGYADYLEKIEPKRNIFM